MFYHIYVIIINFDETQQSAVLNRQLTFAHTDNQAPFTPQNDSVVQVCADQVTTGDVT